MGLTWRAIVGAVLLAASATELTAAESGSRWWPFGRRAETSDSPSSSAAAPSASALQTDRGYSALDPSQRPAGTAATTGSASVAPESASKESWMLSSPKRKIGWPRLTKPEMPTTGLLGQKKDVGATRNSWVEKTPAEPQASPLRPLKDGAHRVAQGTKKAWSKTVDALTPGEAEPPTRPNSSRIARDDPKPSFWERMFGEKEEVRAPQTIPEWMAQDRVDRR